MICDEMIKNALAEANANASINQEQLLYTELTYKTCRSAFAIKLNNFITMRENSENKTTATTKI